MDFSGTKKWLSPIYSVIEDAGGRLIEHYVERETRLELATSTLARLRSTN